MGGRTFGAKIVNVVRKMLSLPFKKSYCHKINCAFQLAHYSLDHSRSICVASIVLALQSFLSFNIFSILGCL